MRILVASDSFKETLTSTEIGQIIKEQIPGNDYTILSVSDGGEGLIEALEAKLDGKRISLEIMDPLGRPIEGYYYLARDTAVIESAVANGIYHLEDHEKNPEKTSTFGVGQLIKDALLRGAKSFLIGIGGSSTNDCGIGMLEALGVDFYNKENQLMKGLKGGDLTDIHSFNLNDLDILFKDIAISIACDVNNPLLGFQGASYVFGPQKGAGPEMLVDLEEAMNNFKTIVSDYYDIDNSSYPGTGAAGGMGYTFLNFFNAHLKPGIDIVLDTLEFDGLLTNIDLVITGEGKLDHQSTRGKVPSGVLERANKKHIPVVAVCAINEGDKLKFEKVFSVVPGIASKEESLKKPRKSFSRLIDRKLRIWLKTYDKKL